MSFLCGERFSEMADFFWFQKWGVTMDNPKYERFDVVFMVIFHIKFGGQSQIP
jgi:hypothetical protein